MGGGARTGADHSPSNPLQPDLLSSTPPASPAVPEPLPGLPGRCTSPFGSRDVNRAPGWDGRAPLTTRASVAPGDPAPASRRLTPSSHPSPLTSSSERQDGAQVVTGEGAGAHKAMVGAGGSTGSAAAAAGAASNAARDAALDPAMGATADAAAAMARRLEWQRGRQWRRRGAGRRTGRRMGRWAGWDGGRASASTSLGGLSAPPWAPRTGLGIERTRSDDDADLRCSRQPRSCGILLDALSPWRDDGNASQHDAGDRAVRQ